MKKTENGAPLLISHCLAAFSGFIAGICVSGIQILFQISLGLIGVLAVAALATFCRHAYYRPVRERKFQEYAARLDQVPLHEPAAENHPIH